MRALSIALSAFPFAGSLAWLIAASSSFNTQLVVRIGVYTAILFGIASAIAVVLAFVKCEPYPVDTFARVISIITAAVFVPLGVFWLVIVLVSWIR